MGAVRPVREATGDLPVVFDLQGVGIGVMVGAGRWGNPRGDRRGSYHRFRRGVGGLAEQG